MLKLSYRITHTYTGAELGDVAAPEIEYTALSHRPEGWTQKVLDFIQGDETSAELACDIIGLIVTSISYEGQRCPMSPEMARQWQADIEAENPGLGAGYMCKMARLIYSKHLDYEGQRLGNSRKLSAPYANGAGSEKSTLPAAVA